MKILAIIGSPRKGNTYKIVQQIEEGIKRCGDDVDFEYLFIKDAHIEPCRGCFACVSKGEQFCPIKDERIEIVEKMSAADGVIFASPGYVFNVSALMKNFIDRLSYVSHRPRFFNKYAMAVTTSGGGGIAETLKYLQLAIRSWGFTFINKVGVMQHPAVSLSQKTIDKVEEASKQFYKAIKARQSKAPKLYDLLQFRIMKFNSVESKKYFSADYEFYKDKKDYYINIKINAIKNQAASIIEKLILKMLKNNA